MPPFGQDPTEMAGLLNRVQNAIASATATGKGQPISSDPSQVLTQASANAGGTGPIGTSGVTAILIVVAIGAALMMMGGKGDKYAD